MEQVKLRAERRTEFGTRPSRRLRREGRVPAIVYGRDLDPTPVIVDRRELFGALHTEAGLNALIELSVADGEKVLTVAREVQRDPVKGDITHLDFIKVSLTEAITAEVGIEFIGAPIGVTRDGGILETIAASIEIEALPTSIPSHIEVDVSEMEVGDVLTVADLPQLEGVTYLLEPDQPIVTISLPAAEVAAEEAEELAEGEEAEAGEGAETEAPDQED